MATFFSTEMQAQTAHLQSAQTLDFGTLPIQSPAGTSTLTFTFDTGGAFAILSNLPVVLTKGATGLDFTDAGTGTCASNGITHVYSAGDSCTVNVDFTPKYAGERDGAVVLKGASGTPIATAYLHGIGSGPQLGFPSTIQTLVGTGLLSPSGVAVDGAGNIYVADTSNNRVLKETLSGGTYTQSVLGSGFSAPLGMAVDAAGNVYVADTNNNRIVEETPGNSGAYTQVALFTGLNLPYSVAVDGTGSVYLADTFNNRVLKETLAGGGYTQSVIGSGLNQPYSVATDSNGNVYIGDNHNNDGILKETPNGSGGYTQTTVVAGPASYGMVVDASGKVYLSETGNNKILKETPSGAGYTQTTTSAGLVAPRGLALDDAGNLYMGDSGNNRILKLDQADPPALIFATTNIGTTSTDSPQTVTLHNNGNLPLVFPVPATGANPSVPANFFYASAATCPQTTSNSSVPYALAAGVTCTVGFSFQPGVAGAVSGSAVLTDNSLNVTGSTQRIPLSGTGVAPDSTATHVTVSANSVVSGGTVNLYATVTDTTSSATIPTGTVTFYDTYNGATNAPAGSQTISNGQINLTNYVPAGVGSHTITATYAPSGAFSASSDTTGQTVTVTAIPTISTMLTISANSVNAGTVVTLTANVKLGTAPLTPGRVIFCDAAAPHCTGSHRLGTAQLTAGTAVFKFVPASGTHSYKAVFVGTNAQATNTSASVSLSVSGSPTSTSTAQNGIPGNYSEFTVVTSAGTVVPSGTISYLDTSNGGYALSASPVTLSGGGTSVSLLSGTSAATGAGPSMLVTGDFNGDGIPDLATANHTDSTLTIVLNHADGSATTLTQALPLGAANPNGIAAGDFNNDGILDLIVSPGANMPPTTASLTLLLGRGDGTFAASPTSLPVADGILSPVVGDFDGDGNLDIAAVGLFHTSSEVVVFRGNGDGSFASPSTPFQTAAFAAFAQRLLVADLNNDSRDDLLIAVAGTPALTVELGTSNGSFTASTLTLSAAPGATTIADLNSDGIADLAIAGTNLIYLYKGNGDGTFTTQAPFTTSQDSQGLATGDFNGDGALDLAASFAGSSNNVAVFYGTGAFAFRSTPSIQASVPSANALVTADYNSDGFPDIAVLDGNSIDRLMDHPTAFATVTAAGLAPVGTGTHQIVASYPGDAIYGPSTSGASGLTAQPVATTLALTASPASSVAGQSVTLTATLTPTAAQGHVTDGETVTFTTHNGTSTLGTGTLSSGIVTLSAVLPGGTNILAASYAGDTNFTGSLSNSLSYAVALATTTTTLTVLTNGTAVSSVASPAAATLTASVVMPNGPVTRGQVQFCETTSAPCTDAHRLGIAQLTAAGTATLTLTPGIGTHSYTASFAGTANDSASSSAPSTLSVTGHSLTTTVLAPTGSSGSYTVTVTASSLTVPTGPVSFLDTSNANYSLATASLVPGVFGTGFGPAQSSPTGTYPNAIATGDFNRDGRPDLVVTNSQSNTLSILLGKGDGTFTASSILGFNNPSFVAVADFNGDGAADLAVANTSTNQVFILLGVGDGTFGAPTGYVVGSTPYALTVGDFNNDGIADLAVANTFSNSVSILLGNGDGSFTAQGEALPTGNGPTSVISADFNHDGRQDLAVTNLNDATVTLFFGAGDGTFPTQSILANVGNSYHLVAGDLNNDGKEDLAVTSNAGIVTVLLGNGDGTFTVSANPTVGSSPNWLTSVDINGDGILDLIVANRTLPGAVTILLGKGDGTFGPAITQAVGALPNGVVAADFNGDGSLDLASANSNDNNTSILLTQLTTTATATVSGVLPVGTGTHLVDAVFPGNAVLGASTSAAIPVTAQPVTSALALAATPSGSNFGQPVTLTATLTPLTAQNHTPNGDAVIFQNGASVVGTATLTNGVASLTLTSLPAGADSLVASFPGDSNFSAAASASLPFTVIYPIVSTPAFSPAAGPYTTAQTVTLATTTANASIFYTTDGSAPSTSSARYSVPLSVSATETIRAIAIATNFQNSPVASATYTINYPPVITVQPLSSTINSGTVLTLTVSATGTAPLAYQWFSGNAPNTAAPIAGATGTAYTPTPALSASASFWVQVSNASGILANSNTAIITVNTPPSITAQPQSATINAGQSATLSVAATGTAPLSYQWFQGVSGDTSKPVATGSTFATPTLTATTSFWVRVSNPASIAVNSATATVTVITPPAITSPASSQTINRGQAATIAVTVTGSNPAFQWFNGLSPTTASPVPGATASQYITPPLTANAAFWVRASNSAGHADSSTFSITVTQPPVCTLTVQPGAVPLTAVASTRCSDPQGQALIQTFNWGDGTVVPALSTTVHTYKASGTYTVTLSATGSSGLVFSTTQLFSPSQSPVCVLGIVQGQVSADVTKYPVSVPASCTDPGGKPLAISIDWGDSSGSQPAANGILTHLYNGSTATTYNVVLTAINTAGLSGSSAPQPVQIVPAQAIAAGGSADVGATLMPPPIPPTVPTQVTFLCASVSTILNGQAINNVLPSLYGITCTSRPVALTDGPTPVNVSIDTTGSTLHAADKTSASPFVFSTLALPFLALLAGKRRRQFTALSLVFILCLTISSCGGYFQAPAVPATPSGLYYVTLVETVVNPPAPTGFVQTSLIVPLPVNPAAKP